MPEDVSKNDFPHVFENERVVVYRLLQPGYSLQVLLRPGFTLLSGLGGKWGLNAFLLSMRQFLSHQKQKACYH
jgi:hypothetical protein